MLPLPLTNSTLAPDFPTNRGFGHNLHRHRSGELADLRFFRRPVRDGPLLDDAHRAQWADVTESGSRVAGLIVQRQE
jgi:hypothetical protein